MFTGHFKHFRQHNDPRLVSVARYAPKWYRGRHYRKLAPPKDMLHHNLTQEEWTAKYYEVVLNKLDPARVYDDLGPDAIMLCWELPGEFCHRRIAAEWLEKKLGLTIPEVPHNFKLEQGNLF